MPFEIDDSDFRAGLDQATDDMKADAERSLRRLADDMASRMTATAPRLTGAGAATIAVTDASADSLVVLDIGPDASAFYLAFYEWGTSHQPPRPFLRPAVEQAVAAWQP
ncbi:MAG: hypothetical protein IPM45_18020 [Acidimicrobiales bacterium]|nr:hypothetical protein [Acidimicrobiales bacterium]